MLTSYDHTAMWLVHSSHCLRSRAVMSGAAATVTDSHACRWSRYGGSWCFKLQGSGSEIPISASGTLQAGPHMSTNAALAGRWEPSSGPHQMSHYHKHAAVLLLDAAHMVGATGGVACACVPDHACTEVLASQDHGLHRRRRGGTAAAY